MVRDFFSKLLRREISSFVRISVTVAPLHPAAGIRLLPFDLISSWRRSRRHTPHRDHEIRPLNVAQVRLARLRSGKVPPPRRTMNSESASPQWDPIQGPVGSYLLGRGVRPTRSARRSQISAMARRLVRPFPAETVRAVSRHWSASRLYSSGLSTVLVGRSLVDRYSSTVRLRAIWYRDASRVSAPVSADISSSLPPTNMNLVRGRVH